MAFSARMRSPWAAEVTRAAAPRIVAVMGSLPDLTYPVDVSGLIHMAGGTIHELDLPGAVCGVSCCLGDGAWAVIVDRASGPRRRRWTLAHELGHMLLHGEQGFHGVRPATDAEWVREVEANTFTAHLLLPQAQVETVLANHHESIWVSTLAGAFGVSRTSVEWRLWELGLGSLPAVVSQVSAL